MSEENQTNNPVVSDDGMKEALAFATLILFDIFLVWRFFAVAFFGKTIAFIDPFTHMKIYKYDASIFVFLFLVLHIIRLQMGLTFSSEDESFNKVKSPEKEAMRKALDLFIGVSILCFSFVLYNANFYVFLSLLVVQALLIYLWHKLNDEDLEKDARSSSGGSNPHQILLIKVGDYIFVAFTIVTIIWRWVPPIWNWCSPRGSGEVREFICNHTCLFIIAAISIAAVHLYIEYECVYKQSVTDYWRKFFNIIKGIVPRTRRG